MISKTMQKYVSTSSAIRAMFEEGKRLSAIYGPENVYDFSLGNPSVEPPVEVQEAIIRVLETESPGLTHGYTNNAGSEDVRDFVANSVNQEFGMNYTQDHVVLTNGAAGALNILFKTLLDPGDEVIVVSPYFGEYNAYAANYGGVIVPVPADPRTFQPDPLAIQAAITRKTRLLILNSPNNPTGVVYTPETIAAISAVLTGAQSRIDHAIYLVSDEPYRYVAYDGVTVPFLPRFYRNTVVAYSFSKALSLPGERIGYLLLHPDMDDCADAAAALSVANRICGFVNAPSLFQRILPACMNLRSNMETYRKNRDLAYAMVTEAGLSCVKPQGAFYLFPQTPIPDDKAFCERAKKERVLLVPGTSFGCPGHFRMAYCVPEATIRNAHDAFLRVTAEFRR